MSENDLDPSYRWQIEQQIGRPLKEDELRVVTSVEELSEAQRDIIRQLGPRPLGALYLGAVAPRVPEKMKVLDRIANGRNWHTIQAWSREPGLGRWRFHIEPFAGETPRQAVSRCIHVVSANVGAFGYAQSVPSRDNPAELILDACVETDEGPKMLSAAGTITFAIVENAVELILVLDVDIHAFVTLRNIDNADLAATNAPRLAALLSMLREQLHARFVDSTGVLPADVTGFTRH